MDMKKICLDGIKKDVYIKVLREASEGLDPDMRRIYGRTIETAAAAPSAMLLTPAQKEISVSALDRYAYQARGTDEELAAARDMLDQLRMSRKEYREKYK